MERVRLVHWYPAGAAKAAERLRSLGYEVDARPLEPGEMRKLPNEAGAALVVDLSRLPSHGRDAAVWVRQSRAGRNVPIVFVGGAPETVERVRQTLPDATFTSWELIGRALRRALDEPVREPVVPESALAGYSGTPLPQKLGIREGSVVALVSAPDGFEELFDSLPAGAVLRRGDRGRRDLTIVFVRSQAEVERRWARAAASAEVDDVWFAWVKKASPLYKGVTQTSVRDLGLARGFVDFKVAAIDETWAALRFKRRQPKP
jgi:hypothetical protein